MITVGDHIVSDSDLTWRFFRSSGSGGQNMNNTDPRAKERPDRVTRIVMVSTRPASQSWGSVGPPVSRRCKVGDCFR